MAAETEPMGIKEAFSYARSQSAVQHPPYDPWQGMRKVPDLIARPAQADPPPEDIMRAKKYVAIASAQEARLNGMPYDEELLAEVEGARHESARFWDSRWSKPLGRIFRLNINYVRMVYPSREMTGTELLNRLLEASGFVDDRP